MKFEFVIYLVIAESIFAIFIPSKKLLIDSKPPGASFSPSKTNLLEKWMRYQARKDKLKHLNFESLTPKLKRLVLSNDFRRNDNSLFQRKLESPAVNKNGMTQEQLIEEEQMKNLEIVEEQKRLILLQFYTIIEESQKKSDIASPNILNCSPTICSISHTSI
jgi:hypothetical protein